MNFTEQLLNGGVFIIMYLCSTTDQYVGTMSMVIVYLGREREEGALEQKSMFHAHIVHPEQ